MKSCTYPSLPSPSGETTLRRLSPENFQIKESRGRKKKSADDVVCDYDYDYDMV